jgi:hypothetical protein
LTYLETVIADAPVHYWRMADPGGRLAHDIGSGIPATLGCSEAQAFPYTGIANDGGAYGAAGSRLHSPGSGVALPGTGWSIEAWAFLSSSLNASANQVILDLNDDLTGTILRLWCQTDGKLGTAGTFFANQLSAALPFGTWHHLAYTFDGLARVSYVDGAAIATVASGAFGAAAYRVDVGNNAAAGEFCYGGVAEVAVYGAALSSARVAAHFAAAEIPLTARPIWVGGGAAHGGGGGIPTSDSLDALIYAAVHKLF